ncbi:MAG: glycosyltransferase family 2 protein [Cyanobacteria bacterium P01_D01_bin.1]
MQTSTRQSISSQQPIVSSQSPSRGRQQDRRQDRQDHYRPEQMPESLLPFVSIVIPAFNESLILQRNLEIVCTYLESIKTSYRWEIILVNDGSKDDTGWLADRFAESNDYDILVVHHPVNMGLGQALKTGFDHCLGDYILTLDLDLSYAPEHIERLLQRIQQSRAKVVVTSPYMRGGKVTNVPWLRLKLSVWANRFLSWAAKRDVATLTGMVRVYDADFLQSLSFRSSGMDINPELLYKAKMLKTPIEEVPAHLQWLEPEADAITPPSTSPNATPQKTPRRKSSMKILRHSWSVFFYGFVFRPVMFFFLPGLLLLLGTGLVHLHVLMHCIEAYSALSQTDGLIEPTQAISKAFVDYPHDFLLAGVTLMLSIQLMGLGVLAMQMKHYFEEIFYLGTQTLKETRAENRTAQESSMRRRPG